MLKNYVKLLFLILFATNSSFSQWINRYNGQGDFSDKYNAVVTDINNNVFIAGSTVNTSVNSDILLVKLNANGDTLWTNVYNGPGNGIDEATAIFLDNNSNIYITGYQRGNSTGTDMVTIKYNSAGVIQWVNPYLSNINSDQTDRGNSIIVDASGNVYVTGQTDSDPTIVNNDDYITIKYNASGVQQWSKLFNGTGNGTDRSVKILLDATNNPIVTGRSFNGTEDDYVTIKYSGATGTQTWLQTADRTHYDRPTDMVINPTNGNIYVTGRSKNITYDYLTVAYSTAGVELWQAVYDYIDDDRATAIAINAAGEIYVTGQSDYDVTATFNYDITTVKYDALGNQLWAKTYTGAASNDDVATDIVVDNAGNAFVTGYTDTDGTITISNDFITLGYTSAGASIFSTTYSNAANVNDIPVGITLDNTAKIIVVGSSELIPQRNATALKYNSSGVQQWAKSYNGIGDNSSNSHAIAVDANGNSFVAGYTLEYGTDRNFALQKIDPNGNTIWMRTLNGTSTASIDDAYGVAVDANGNIFVGGFLKNLGQSYDYRVAKYNQLGDTLWTRSYNYTTANESDKAIALELDASGNVILTGKSDSDPNITSNDDVLTVKWNTNGTLLWATRYNGTGNLNDSPKSMKVSPAGNIYVAGKTFNGTNNDYLLLKYNSSGVQQWVKTFNGNGADEAVKVAIDNSENIYITGFSASATSSDTNIVTIKYDVSGALIWSKTFDGAASGNDHGESLAIDNSGNVVVAGTSDSDANSSTLNNNIVTIKYDANGNELWNKIYDNPNGLDDQACEVGIDILNNIYVSGQSETSATLSNYDYVAIKYAPNGVQDSIYHYNGTGNAKDIPSTMLVKGLEILVTGGSLNQDLQRDLVTVRYYGTADAGLNDLGQSAGSVFKIYPNPSSNYVVIDVSAIQTKGNNISLKILNLNGSEVFSTMIDNSKMTLNTEKLSPGVYFVQIENANKISQTQKLVIQ
jgi:uncharacterized delta-60 repeat protein